MSAKVPKQVAQLDLTGQTAAITSTVLFTSDVDGLYLFSYSLVTNSISGSGFGLNIDGVPTISNNDGAGTRDNTNSRYLPASTSVNYSVDVQPGTTTNYDIHVVVYQL